MYCDAVLSVLNLIIHLRDAIALSTVMPSSFVY
jgi:hypothetical protein